MNEAKFFILYAIYTILFIGIIVGICIFANYRTEELMGWAEVYEVCVKAEYGVTPTEYYRSNNHYPECDTSKYEKKMELE